ncbi:DUF3099 domain-containing protein [Georgenia wangjunii]|uniref:DUF3099 domain-containing protein n=1 Tax=Georgenia wangjunii TaxID=3117730 RepID=UPI002F26C0FB
MRSSGVPHGKRGRDRGVEVHAITSAGRALTDDVHDRATRYLISMAIRTACVIGAAFTEDWVRWTLVAGAVVLPYIAVVLANAGRERPAPATTLVAAPALGPGPSAGPGAFPAPGERPGRPRSTGVPVDLDGGYLR